MNYAESSKCRLAVIDVTDKHNLKIHVTAEVHFKNQDLSRNARDSLNIVVENVSCQFFDQSNPTHVWKETNVRRFLYQ